MMKNCRFGWTNPLTLYLCISQYFILYSTHLKYIFFPQSLPFLSASFSWTYTCLLVDCMPPSGPDRNRRSRFEYMSVSLYLERMHYVYRLFSLDLLLFTFSVLNRKYFFSFILLRLEDTCQRRRVKQYLTYWDLLQHVSEWTGCLSNDILAAPPHFLLALWHTERDDSQKLSDTAHLTKAHPRAGDLTTSAPRLTWAGDKGPQGVPGARLVPPTSFRFLHPFPLPPSVLLSSARWKCALACELEKREPQKTCVTLH